MSKWSRAQLVAALFALSFDLTPYAATAQTKRPVRRLAIVCDAADPQSEPDARRFRSRAAGALLKSGRFSIVDRAKLDRLLREQGLSNSDYADPNTAATLGKLAGAEQLLNLDFTENMQVDRGAFIVTVACHVSVDYTLVNVSTGRTRASGSADGDAQEKSAPNSGGVSSIAVDALKRSAIDDCIADLLQQIVT